MNALATKSKENQSFSFFGGPITNITPLCDCTINDVYNLIKGATYKETTETLRQITDEKQQADYKKRNFDYVTFSGTFSKRQTEAILARSVFFCIDLDHISDVKATRAIILNNLRPALLFVSPRGNGLKIVYKIDVSAGTHEQYFHALEAYFIDIADLSIDKQCKDQARACFLSHDEQAYFDQQPDVLDKSFLDTYNKPKESPENGFLFNANVIMSPAVKLIREAVNGSKHGELLKAARLAGGYVAGGANKRK